MTYYRWYKMPQVKSTMVEVTKDYFADGDEYINEKNGWTKIESDFIVIGE